MIIEHMTISAREGQLAQLYSALVSLTGPTEVERGCLSCRVFESRQEPNKVFIQAKWAGAEDLMLHLQSDTYKRILLLMELSPCPPILQFYMVQEIQGLDLVEKARSGSH